MTSGYYRCPAGKDFGQRIIFLLVVFLLFPDTTEKDSSEIGLHDSNSQGRLTLQQQQLIFKYSPPPSDPQHYRSPLFDAAWFYVSLESNNLELSIIWNLTPSSSTTDSSAKKNYINKDHQLEVQFSHIYMLFIEDIPKPSFYIIIMINLMYQHRQGIILKKTSEMFILRSEEGEKNETAQSQIMLPTFVIVSISALGISTVVGFFTNSFIIVAHGMDRAKGRNINPRELILFTLGLFNIAFQCTMVANDSLLFLWSDLYFSENVYIIFSILLLFTIFSSFWFTFCLCGFYYLMLVTFGQTFFMHLKQSISKVVPCMLFFSALLSLFISVPVAWNIKKEDHSGQLDGNFTVQIGMPHMNLKYLLVTSIIGCCIPLILVAFANVLIIKSLCVNAKHLRTSAGGISVQSVQASISAAHTVTSLLLLYISFYVSETLLIMDVFKVDSPWMSVCLVTVYSYAPVQSVILIIGSPNLREMIKRMLCPCKLTDDMPSGVLTDPSSSVSTMNMSISSINIGYRRPLST